MATHNDLIEVKGRQRVFAFSFLGTQFATTESEKRHVIFSNVVYVTLPIVYSIFMLIDYKALLDPAELWKFDRLIFIAIVSLCLSFLYLNKLGYIVISRILFLICWILLLHIIPIIIQNTPSDYYIAYPLGLMFHSFLIHLCFSAHQEKRKFWPFLILNGVLMLTAHEFLTAFDLAPAETNSLRGDPYFELDIILYWLLINLLCFYFFYVFENYISQLNSANEFILMQQKEMVKKNEDLESALQSLKNVNSAIEDLNRNLEQKVADRTRELLEKNDTLMKYAFINAHLLRGPLCRIKGLSYLRQVAGPNDPDAAKIETMMAKSIDELDQITIDIQALISEHEQKVS